MCERICTSQQRAVSNCNTPNDSSVEFTMGLIEFSAHAKLRTAKADDEAGIVTAVEQLGLNQTKRAHHN